MPTYQYVCTDCTTPLEVQQAFTDDPVTQCPSCPGRLRKVFSAVGVVFKGSGFYRNDSRVPQSDGSGKGSGKDTGKDSGKDANKDSGTSGGDAGSNGTGKGDSSSGRSDGAGAKPAGDSKPAAAGTKTDSAA